MADKKSKLTYTIEINDKGKIKIEGLTKGFVQADTAVKSLNKSLQKTTQDGLNPMIDKTGLAGATLVELGRTISDLPYGIRGIANNLSQLSTLMTTLIATTGGLKNGWDAIKQAFMGPLGLIVVFQAVIAAVDHFAGSTSKATDEVDKIGTASAAAGSNLKILRDVMDDSSLSTEELQRAVNKANKEYKDLNIQIDENGRVTEESRKQIDLKILSLERLAKATAVQKEIERVFTEISKSQVAETKALQAEEDKRDALEQTRINNRNKALQTGVSISTEATETIIQRNKEAVKKRFKEQREELVEELNILTGILTKEDLVDELFKPPKGPGKRLPKRAKEVLLEFDSELKNFFLDIDKDGVEGVLVKGIERVKRLYEPLFESGKRGSEQLKRLGEDFKEIQERNEESLKAGLKFIKEQAKEVTGLFKASQQSLKFVGDTILSYHDARMDALKRERDYVLHSGELTGAAQKKAIEDLEKREIRSQQRKIKAERDLFTIKQSLLIAEEIMKIKADFAERKRMFEQQTVYFVNAQGRIVAKAAESTADATFSIGEFARQLGPIGIATYAVTIGGLIASIMSARKKAQASLASLGAPSMGGGGGGGGVEAPDFNVVGASPESQLAQSVMAQQQKPLRAFVVNKDIKTAEELERNTVKALG
jgi:hypothetical protein